MCNLYSLTKGQQAIRELTRTMTDRTGNLPSLPGIFPDQAAPILRNQPEGRELTMARWGMPSFAPASSPLASDQATAGSMVPTIHRAIAVIAASECGWPTS
jgi:putative SOS response-associated peptidase YedK